MPVQGAGLMMKKWRQFFWRWRGVLTITPGVAAVVILMRSVGLLQPWEWAVFDQYMRLRPAEATDSRVVIVGIDESDIETLKQPLITDETLAQLIEALKAQSPRAIGLDLYRDLPVTPGEQALLNTFNSTPNLIGIRKVVGESGREIVAPPPALAALGQVGANDLVTDADNTIRRGLFYVKDVEGNTVYSLSLYLALLHLEAERIAPEMAAEDVWWLGEALFKPFESSSGSYIRADDRGYQQIINYRGAARSFETVSLLDVLNQQVPSDWATDKVVLIGAVSESSKDIFHTPYSAALLALPEPMAGVEIHANLTSQIISAALDGRSLIKSWPEPVEWGWILLWSAAGAGLVWHYGKSNKPTQHRWKREVSEVGALALLGASTYVPFLYGWWLPVVPAFLAAVGSAVAVTAYQARSAKDIRRTFGRYLSDEIVTTLLENPEGQKLGGDRRCITILTSDLRGFTATSERLPPETVIKVLNFYLGCMADVITRYQGTIDEFMGDGILVLFGAPIKREHDAQRAIACAVDMQIAMATVNETITSWGLSPLEMGIGIHTGEVVVGNIGSEKRTKYGIVGSPVNLTYRIESFTTGGQILISDETRQAVGIDILEISSQQQVSPKGVARPITIYDVKGIGAPYNLSLQSELETFVPLANPLSVCFSVLEGKHINNSNTQGHLVEISSKGALLTVEDATLLPLTALDNLKLNFFFPDADDSSEDSYAKVLRPAAMSNSFYIRFTAQPQETATLWNRFYQKASTVT